MCPEVVGEEHQGASGMKELEGRRRNWKEAQNGRALLHEKAFNFLLYILKATVGDQIFLGNWTFRQT